jgi:hypothetical protein
MKVATWYRPPMTNQDERAHARRIEQMVMAEARLRHRLMTMHDEMASLMKVLNHPSGHSRQRSNKFKSTNVVEFGKRGPTWADWISDGRVPARVVVV